MKATRFRDLSDDELAHEIEGLRKALFNLRVQQAIGQFEKPHQLPATRRDLARALTVQRERSAGEENQ